MCVHVAAVTGAVMQSQRPPDAGWVCEVRQCVDHEGEVCCYEQMHVSVTEERSVNGHVDSMALVSAYSL